MALENPPPAFGDLGKSANDLFSKGFNFGFFTVDASTKTDTNISFASNVSAEQKTGHVDGSLETKYKCPDYGLTLTEKWTTDNSLATNISVEDHFAKGVKVGIDTKFTPQSGDKTAKAKGAFKKDFINAQADVDLNGMVTASAVGGYKNMLVGYQVGFDGPNQRVTTSNIAGEYAGDNFTLFAGVNKGTDFYASVYQKVNPHLEAGVQLDWASGSNNNTKFGLGAKYTIDDDSVFKGKITNASQIGMSYQQKFREGITFTFCSLIEGKTLNQGGHKVGLGVEFEA